MQGKILQFFFLDTLKIYFKMKIQQRWTQSGPFFSKVDVLFSIFKKDKVGLPTLP